VKRAKPCNSGVQTQHSLTSRARHAERSEASAVAVRIRIGTDTPATKGRYSLASSFWALSSWSEAARSAAQSKDLQLPFVISESAGVTRPLTSFALSF
jgi:hypothetical protein